MIDNNNNNGPYVSHDQRPRISLKDQRPKITYKGRTTQAQGDPNAGKQASGRNQSGNTPSEQLSHRPEANSKLVDALGGVVSKVRKSHTDSNAAESTKQLSQSQSAAATSKLKAGVSRDTEVMNFVRSRDGQYLCSEGQFIRRGNTFIVTDGPMKDYKVVYKGGRNFQIRNPDGESLMIYHGPRRRPRIAPGEGEQINPNAHSRRPTEEA